MSIRITNARLFTPLQEIQLGEVRIGDDGKIVSAGRPDESPGLDEQSVDAGGRILAPGFIDIHVHGGSGVTFGEGDVAAGLQEYSRWVVRTGVTGFVCSIAAPNREALLAMIARCVEALAAGLPGAEGLGLHLEGPYLNPEKKGAFNPNWLHAPSVEEAAALLQAGRGWVRQVTLAPELPGALETAAYLRQAGVVVALGHTNTDYETASQALRDDFTHVTHTYNAQRSFDHRAPGVIGAVLASDSATAELIADGVHVHPGAMKVLQRAVGPERVVLVTDAMSAAGLPDGVYELVGNPVIVKDGQARLPDGTLAGSTATLNLCVRNMHACAGVPLPQALAMASLNPARAIGLAGRLGSIEPGRDASLVLLDEDMTVRLVLVRGAIVYRDLA